MTGRAVVRRRTPAVALLAAVLLGLAAAGLPAIDGPGPANAAGWLAPAVVLAASPTPGAAGDTRSSEQAPGFVGAPLLAIGGVVGVGLLSLALTLAYVRMTGAGRAAREPGWRDPPARR